MHTIQTDFPAFKALAGDFFRLLPGCTTVEQVQQGSKCLLLAFVGLNGDELELHQAQIVIDLAERAGATREREILLLPLLAKEL